MAADEITTIEASEILQVTPTRVVQLIYAELLPARKHGRDWAIPRQAVEELAKLERPAGNPNFRRQMDT